MPWTYDITSGELTGPDGSRRGKGYSGREGGLNNPDMEAVPNTGPIPDGTWMIGPLMDHPSCGPLAMRLTPAPGTDARGRSGFLIHGDNASRNHTASHGCIILDRALRQEIGASDDKVLIVVP